MSSRKKVSCDKHYRYVANCPDCVALNKKIDEEGTKRLYTNAAGGSDRDGGPRGVEIPDFAGDRRSSREHVPESAGDKDHDDTEASRGVPGIFNRSGRPRGGGGDRFRYNPIIGKLPKKIKRIIIITIILIILIIGLYAYPVWHGKISLYSQLYENKAGGIDYWNDIYTMNGWSNRFFFNYPALIGALIGCTIMCFPPDDNILLLMKDRISMFQNLTKKKVVIFWWTFGFMLFFLISQGLGSDLFALTVNMFKGGTLSTDQLTNNSYFAGFNVIHNPDSVTMIDVFVFLNLVKPFITFTVGVIIFRLILNIINYLYLRPNNLKLISMIFFLIAVILVQNLFGQVNTPHNAIEFIRIKSIYLGIIGFFILGLVLLFSANKNPDYIFPQFNMNSRETRIMVSTCVVMIFIVLIPVFTAVPKSISLSNYNNWVEYEWDVRYEREGDWTRIAAGIDLRDDSVSADLQYFTTEDIDNYTNIDVNSSEIIAHTRQYDKTISGKEMIKLITNTAETMADSDIIYVNGGEYWIAPHTLEMDFISQDNVRLSTEQYDHVNGFEAIDTRTGDIVLENEKAAIFGVNDTSIYFGEKEDPSYETSSSSEIDETDTFEIGETIDAFTNDILLTDAWHNGYSGDPDGNLTGLEAFWTVQRMGLSSYAFDGGEKSFLINRNIKQRINTVLMPGLKIDADPYLVFSDDGKMYYATAIYTNIEIGSYASAPLMRFLGYCLIDVKTGDMIWYKNPAAPMGINDPLYSLWNIYNDIYPWETAPDWFKEQMRYPETLYEAQLSVDYYYHVRDPKIWKNGNNFYERPETGDVFYIETDLGEGLEFVAVELVEYIGEDALQLAGLYVMRHGDHFGEVIFYETAAQTINGPETARLKLSNEASSSIDQLDNVRYGNILLYPLYNSLYYFIPVYTGTTTEFLTVAGLINVFTLDVYYTSTEDDGLADVLASFNKINDTSTPDVIDPMIGSFDVIVDAPSIVEYDVNDWAEMQIQVENWNTSLPPIYSNVTLNLTTDYEFDVSLYFQANALSAHQYVNGTTTYYEYTIYEDSFLPGQGSIDTVLFNPASPYDATPAVFDYTIELFDNDTGTLLYSEDKTITFIDSVLEGPDYYSLIIDAPTSVNYNENIWPEMGITFEFWNTSAPAVMRNLSLVMSLQTDVSFNVSLYNQMNALNNETYSSIGYNYTIFDNQGYWPGQGDIFTVLLNPVSPLTETTTFYYFISLYDTDLDEYIIIENREITFIV